MIHKERAEAVVKDLLGSESQILFAFVTQMHMRHLEREHGLSHLEACERLGVDPEEWQRAWAEFRELGV